MPSMSRRPLSLLDLPDDLQAQVEQAARKNKRPAMEELIARIRSSFEPRQAKTTPVTNTEHELARLSLESYNLTMELRMLQLHFHHAEQDSEKRRLAMQIDEMACRVGRLEAERIATLHKTASLQL